MDTSLADKQIAGSTNKKLSTESRALEPAMRSGSDGSRALTCKKLVVIFLPKYVVKQTRGTAVSLPFNGRLDKTYHLSI